MPLDLTVLSLALSFALGMSCVLMPCCLPAVTGFVQHTMGAEREPRRKRLFLISNVFAIGVLVPFTLVGATFAAIGAYVRLFFQPFTYVLASTLLLMGILHIAGKEFSLPIRINVGQSKGMSGAFQKGIVYGFGAADCAIMILAPVFFLSLAVTNFWVNIANFVAFGLGRSFPILLSSLLLPDIRVRFVSFFSQKARAMNLATGSMIMLGGLLMFLSQF